MVIFHSNQRITLLDFSRNLDFLKTHKNLYTKPLCITNPEYELHVQEIRIFGQILPQTSFFLGKTEG
jgi:hypothetical protein